MEYLNAFIVTLLVFGPTAMAMLYARSLIKETNKELADHRTNSLESFNHIFKFNTTLVEREEAFEEEKAFLYSRIDKLEAANKSGGRELLKRARKAKRGNRIVNVQIAPKIKAKRELVYNLSKPKSKSARK
jgi:hypothetical protein